MITAGRVVIDCRPGNNADPLGHATTRLVQSATFAPKGADVVLIVGDKQWPTGIAYLVSEGAHIGTLTIESSCSYTVRTWINAIREAS